jgi:hypothetical protein
LVHERAADPERNRTPVKALGEAVITVEKWLAKLQ